MSETTDTDTDTDDAAEPTKDELLDGLRDLADDLGRTPGAIDLMEWDRYHHSEYEKYWSDHIAAIEAAGLELTFEQRAVKSLRKHSYNPSESEGC